MIKFFVGITCCFLGLCLINSISAVNGWPKLEGWHAVWVFTIVTFFNGIWEGVNNELN